MFKWTLTVKKVKKQLKMFRLSIKNTQCQSDRTTGKALALQGAIWGSIPNPWHLIILPGVIPEDRTRSTKTQTKQTKPPTKTNKLTYIYD